MDDQIAVLEEKQSRLMTEIADVTVELDRLRGERPAVPHYSVIELQAHELGQELSRAVQQRQMGELTAQAARSARCPGCQSVCEVRERKRHVTALDGELEMLEPTAHCDRCRRDFFPAEGTTGL